MENIQRTKQYGNIRYAVIQFSPTCPRPVTFLPRICFYLLCLPLENFIMTYLLLSEFIVLRKISILFYHLIDSIQQKFNFVFQVAQPYPLKFPDWKKLTRKWKNRIRTSFHNPLIAISNHHAAPNRQQETGRLRGYAKLHM